MPARQPDFSPKEVANALGVGESSVKRWCDAGSIQAAKTSGGHRRITLDAVLRYVRDSKFRLVDPAAIGLAEIPPLPQPLTVSRSEEERQSVCEVASPVSLDPQQQRFAEGLAAGDESVCREVLLAHYAECGSATQTAEHLINPAMAEIGAAWDCQGLEIYQERRACGIADRLIMELRARVIERTQHLLVNAPRAVGCAPAGDPYTLPTALVELALRETGWDACNHGNNLPLDSLLKAVNDSAASLVWVSISYVADRAGLVDRFNRLADALHDDVILVVGGQGLDESLRPELRYTAYCDALCQLVNLANTMRHRFAS